MGVVYRAHDKKLDRIVALKLLLLGRFSSDQAIKRFQREARAAAALHHPNIVAVHEVGLFEGQHYFTMEFVEGRSLASLLQDGPLPPREAALHLHALTQAIAAAHAADIIHRDLKPSNILIDILGQPRLTDFGLAKRLNSDSQPSTQDSQLTLTGQFLGSPNYAAPEITFSVQQDATPSADIFSLGAILYECLTGRPPFLSASIQETLLRIRDTEPVPPRSLNRNIPLDLQTICLKCLEKDPSKRYATAQVLADDLRRFLNNEPISARPIGPAGKILRWSKRNPALAAAYSLLFLLLLLLVIGSPLAIYRINHARQKAEQNLYAADMLLAQDALTRKDLKRTLQLLGKYNSNSTDLNGLRGWEWRYMWGQTQSDELFTLATNSGPFLCAAWTDQNSIACLSRSVSSRSVHQLALREADNRQILTNFTIPGPAITVHHLQEGGLLTAGAREADNSIILWDSRTQRITELPTKATTLGVVAFNETGTKLAATGKDWVGVWDLATGHEAIRIQPPGVIIANDRALAISGDGKYIAYNNFFGTHANSHIVLAEAENGRSIAHLKGHTNQILCLAFSHDGQTLASGSFDGVVNLWDLKTLKSRLRFVADSSVLSTLAFSPHDEFLATGGWDHKLAVWRTSNGEELAALQGHLGRIQSIAFSADSARLCTASDDGTVRVWSRTVPPKQSCAVTNSPFVFNAKVSPGGGLASFDGNDTVTIWDATNLIQRSSFRIPDESAEHVAYASGGKLTAIQHTNNTVGLYLTEPFHRIATLTKSPEPVAGLSFSADGSLLAIVRTVNGSDSVSVWNWTSEQELGRATIGPKSVLRVGFSRDAELLAVSHSDGSIDLCRWRKGDGSSNLVLRGPAEGAYRLFFLSDRRRLVSMTGAGGPICIWDLVTGKMIAELWGQLTNFTDITESADGRRLAAGGNDGTITIWDLQNYQEVGRLAAHHDRVLGIAFLPDGNTLISISRESMRAFRAASFHDIALKREHL